MRKLSNKQKRDIGAIKDEDIDFSDIPLVLDRSKAEMSKFYRPPKKSVTIRLDADVLKWLKGYGRRYQTRGEYAIAPCHDKFRAGRSFAAGEVGSGATVTLAESCRLAEVLHRHSN